MAAPNQDPNVIVSPLPATKVPTSSLGQYFLNRLRSHGTNVYLIDSMTDQSMTFRDLLGRSISLAKGLKKLGVEPGDVVGIFSENRPNVIFPMVAAFYLGAPLSPINPSYTKAEILHAIRISRPKVIFVSPRTEQKLADALREEPSMPQLIQLASESTSGVSLTLDGISESLRFGDLDEYEAYDPVDHRNHAAVILYSSGTTGLPKGVMLSHRNMLVLLEHFRDPNYIYTTQDRPVLGFLPIFHGYGLALLLGCASNGGRYVMLAEFDPVKFLTAIDKYKIFITAVAPPVMVFLAKHPIVDKFDLRSLRDIACGAAPLSEEVLTTVKKRLGNVQIREGYGMTELTVIVSLNPNNAVRPGSVGVVSSNTMCKTVDVETGKSLGPGQRGELCFKGDLVMMGYRGDPKATAETIDADGWLHTGDVGYCDRDGYIYVIDRIKELIKYKGFQVPPAELEAILLTHPAVKDAAVIGIPDEKAGEVPLAFVVRQPGARATPEDIRKFVDGQVSSPKQLRGGVKFIPEIAKNPSGKILRRELRKLVSKL